MSETTTATTPVVATTTSTTENSVPHETQPSVDNDFVNKLKAHKEKLKVNGEEIEVDYETMKRDYQMRKASDAKMREAADLKKQAIEIVNALRTNPKEFLKNPNLGIDIRTVAEEILAEELEEELMDPRDRELKKYKKMIEEQQEQERLAKEEQEQRTISELREKYAQDYSNQIVETLKTSGLPKTEHTVKRMAYYMHQAVSNGYDLKPQDLAEMVRQDYINEHKSLYGAMDEDILMKMLDSDVIKKIRKAEQKRLNSGNLPKTPKNQPDIQVVKKKSPQSKKMTVNEWKERLKRFD